MENPSLPAEAEILSVKRQTHDTKTFRIAFRDKERQKRFDFRPGQFNMVGAFGVGEAPFSLCSDPFEKDAFEHTIRNVGMVTGFLDRLEEGETVFVRGPYGNGWPVDEARRKNVLIVAGGIGLPPLRPVLYQIRRERGEFGEVEILYGARTPADLVFTDEFDDFRKIGNLLLTVDRVPSEVEWKHNVGAVTTLLDKMRMKPKNTLVMTCGPEIMMHFVVLGLLKLGFEADQLYVSMERRMKCGIGKCGHCQVGPKFVCKDGPIFRYSDVRDLPDKIL